MCVMWFLHFCYFFIRLDIQMGLRFNLMSKYLVILTSICKFRIYLGLFQHIL